MGLSHEHAGPKILAKIQIYILTRAELLFTLCYEIPCTLQIPHIKKLETYFALFIFLDSVQESAMKRRFVVFLKLPQF